MRAKPVYNHPNFIINVDCEKNNSERWWLRLEFNNACEESLLVILKNPSRASENYSDKTVFTICNYIEKNRTRHEALRNVKYLYILNLYSMFETYSKSLHTHSGLMNNDTNLTYLEEYIKLCDSVILAWGNPPKGLKEDYLQRIQSVFEILQNNPKQTYYVGSISKKGHPKHGQVWKYADSLINYF